METILYTAVTVLLFFYLYDAFKLYRGQYKGRIYSSIYSGFMEFFFRYKFRNDASESSYFKNRIGKHKIIYNSYLNEKYQPLHSFVTVVHSKGILVCYIFTSSGSIAGKDSDKNLIVRHSGKAYRILGPKEAVDKHVALIKKNCGEEAPVDVCYFFKDKVDYTLFKTHDLTSPYKKIVEVLENQQHDLSEFKIDEYYAACTTHLVKEK